MTHRQFRTWQSWLHAQWDVPSRSDHYLMSVAQAVDRPNLKKGAKVTLADYRLSFSGKKSAAPTPPQSMAENKAVWLQATAGLKGASYTPGPGG